jgi:guanylate kinase
MLSALQRPQLIEVAGASRTGKTTILHEVAWTAQIKGLFELGISIFDATRSPDELKEFLTSRKFRERTEGTNASLMIAIDNLDHSVLEQHSELF